jgi:uncharacterized membrane protein YdjX (TVP38/TMEM64 family)
LLLILRRTDLNAHAAHVVASFRDAGALPFFAAMAILPAAGFPLALFAVTAGPVFGPTLGAGQVIVYSILALAVNVALSYGIAISALRPLVARWVAWIGYSLPEIKGGSAWEIVLMVRIIPGPPFFLQSYFLGLARTPFGAYMLISTLVPSVYFASIVLFGNALFSGNRMALAAGALLLLLAGTVTHRLRKRLFPSKSARQIRTSVTARQPAAHKPGSEPPTHPASATGPRP